MRHALRPFTLALLLAACAGDDVADPSARSLVERSPDQRYLVALQPGTASGTPDVVLSRGQVVRRLHRGDTMVVELPDDALDAVAAHPDVRLVEPDRRRALDDLVTGAQARPYGIDLVQAPAVWEHTRGGDRTVCVIDSGLDTGHESIQTTHLSGDAGVWDSWTLDYCGHGTHVTGTIAALDNGVGVVGMLPDGVRTHVVKVFDDYCSWTWASNLVDALDACRDAGAHVVNMSLGGSYSSVVEREAFQQAWDDGLLLVAAAGNTGASGPRFPASYDSVISVAAVDRHRVRASFSTYNDAVELAAPGVDVLSTVPPFCTSCSAWAEYEAWSGTSMATPHVAGAAALIWSADPTWTNAQIRDALVSTAEDLGEPGRDRYYGHGLIRARAALDHLLDDCTNGCAPPPIAPELLARFDFDDETRLPAEVVNDLDVGPFERLLGTTGFAGGVTGHALSGASWTDAGDALVFSVRSGSGATVELTGLRLAERPSPSGPTGFKVALETDDGLTVVADASTDPGAWTLHELAIAHPPASGTVWVHLIPSGAAHSSGTWRIDDVELLGAADGPSYTGGFDSTPPTQGVVGQRYEYVVVPSGDGSPRLSVAGLPDWLAFDGVATIAGIPPGYAVGRTSTISVYAWDDTQVVDTQEFTIDVAHGDALRLVDGPLVEDFGPDVTPGWAFDGDWELGPLPFPNHGVYVAATRLDGNYTVPSHSRMTTPLLDLTGVADPVLVFHSRREIDVSWHGVNVLISTDAGETFEELAPQSVTPRYDGVVEQYPHASPNPIAGQRAWLGPTYQWHLFTVDLGANLAARRDEVVLLFQLSTDDFGAFDGWRVGAVRIGAASDIAASPVSVAFAD